MITDEEKDIIVDCARKYDVKKVLLFGSAAEGDEYRDIDLAVEGIKSNLFFKFYGELYMKLPKSVDLVDLEDDVLFTRLIKRDGIKLYG